MSPLVSGILAICALFIISLFFWGKKFLLLPGKYRYPMLAALVAGMGFSIWSLQAEETRNELTLMGVCWVDGVAYYPEGGDGDSEACTTPEPIKWHATTLSVYWIQDKDFDVYRESHRLAMEWWNKEMGQEMLVPTDDIATADIIFEHGSVNEGRGAMSTVHSRRPDGRLQARIIVKVPGDIREWMLEEQHEFGHVWGLGHDRSGIMKRDLSEGEEMRVWLFHDKDKNAIRALYETPETGVSEHSDAGSSDGPSPPATDASLPLTSLP